MEIEKLSYTPRAWDHSFAKLRPFFGDSEVMAGWELDARKATERGQPGHRKLAGGRVGFCGLVVGAMLED